MAVKQDKITKLFAAYVAPRKILIADTNNASRAGIARFLTNLGAKTANLLLVSSYTEAEASIKKNKPQIVICDYDLGSSCGLSLLQKQREECPDTANSLFVLVTGNTSQSAVAQAAEEDVDTFILKPYTLEVFRQAIIKAALQKIYPSDYLKKIEEGKKQLEDKKFDEAIAVFEEATNLDPKPSLACFYKGQSNFMKKLIEDAEGSFASGLKHNKIHYKCLVGLFDILMEKQEWLKAYELVKKLCQYFPSNPKRLATVLRLAIMTKSYDDIERYYQIFTSLDQRNDEIIRYVCAALVVVGRHYLDTGHRKRAMDLFNNAGVTAGGRVKVLREIIQALMDKELVTEAEKYLKRFPADTQNGEDYLAMSLLIREQGISSQSVLDDGRKYIKDGIHDPVIYLVLIRLSLKHGLVDYAETLRDDGSKRWEARKAEFEAPFKSGEPEGEKKEEAKAGESKKEEPSESQAS